MRIDSLQAQLEEVLCEHRKSLQWQEELQSRLEAQSSETLKLRERVAALESPPTMASESHGSRGLSSPIAGLNICGMDSKPRRKRAGQPLAETPSPRRGYTPPSVATTLSAARKMDLFSDIGF